MPLSPEHIGSKIPAKIQMYLLTRAELLITLCYEIPCIIKCFHFLDTYDHFLEARADIGEKNFVGFLYIL